MEKSKRKMSNKYRFITKFFLQSICFVISFGTLTHNSSSLANGGSDYTIRDGGTVFWGVRTAGGGEIITNQIGFEYGVGTNKTSLLYENLVFDEQDVGKTFTVTATEDPDFNLIVEKLTNGIIDDVFLNVTFANGDKIESTTSDSLGNTDFQGWKINSIDLVINSLEITAPGNDPNGDGNWTQVTYDVESIINVTKVPEPSFLRGVLGLFGLAGITLLKKFKKP
ncbi:hypothetical protein cce_1453 [Crocosphaera subtropica ATCC 51142]|uniref:PEP-CTERM protein-sorting domain-containing protein n=2 Tax=Crocosphaera TaxID=263510 RepID=B1WX59_CROS5|nr:hypothetical protein cce_1453 [Crocosphaera subtropica ATCC 51142]